MDLLTPVPSGGGPIDIWLCCLPNLIPMTTEPKAALETFSTGVRIELWLCGLSLDW